MALEPSRTIQLTYIQTVQSDESPWALYCWARSEIPNIKQLLSATRILLKMSTLFFNDRWGLLNLTVTRIRKIDCTTMTISIMILSLFLYTKRKEREQITMSALSRNVLTRKHETIKAISTWRRTIQVCTILWKKAKLLAQGVSYYITATSTYEKTLLACYRVSIWHCEK